MIPSLDLWPHCSFPAPCLGSPLGPFPVPWSLHPGKPCACSLLLPSLVPSAATFCSHCSSFLSCPLQATSQFLLPRAKCSALLRSTLFTSSVTFLGHAASSGLGHICKMPDCEVRPCFLCVLSAIYTIALTKRSFTWDLGLTVPLQVLTAVVAASWLLTNDLCCMLLRLVLQCFP